MAPPIPLGLLASMTLLLLEPVVLAQQDPSYSSPLLRNVFSVRRAATAMPANQTAAGVALFPSELLQLTDDSLESSLQNSGLYRYRDIFDFDSSDGNRCKLPASMSKCKLLPGDCAWPDEFVWTLFGRLLGDDTLVPIIPIAAPCYPKSEFDNYNAAECQSIVDSFNTSELQYVRYLFVRLTRLCFCRHLADWM